jgi:fused signal recognition particle receptor
MSKFFNWLNKDKNKNVAAEPVEQAANETTDSENHLEKASEIEVVTQQSDSETNASVAPVESLTHITIVEKQKNDEFEQKVKGQETTLPVTSEASFFSRLKRGLSRTTESIGSGLANLFRGKTIDAELFEELETQLLIADVGITTTSKMVAKLTESADRKQLRDADALFQLLKSQMVDILSAVDNPLKLETDKKPFVILMVGVNGVGKTTTIGKMAKQFQQQGKKVMLAAGDTFRAAAVEQLQVWGERNNIPVVAQQSGADSASVIFDAFQSAKAKNIDVLIADTAGRLQNKDHLMEELKKVVRVMKKIDPQAPHEIMLTLDAGTGQNALSQTKIFNEAVGLTGLSLTKLDGTAKGGVIFAIADQFPIPIRFIGIGEGIEDLRPFNSKEFVEALFADTEKTQSKQQHH